ncbi:MAG: 4-hydroxy-tetrahydrodipicolinate synthase [Promethearchaeati archaeon SRVP18_Atabeyarchaeia-1]
MSKNFKLSGVIPALVTPFAKDDEEVDEGALKSLIDFVISKGVTGVVPCGTTGEFTSMSDSEKQRVLKLTVDHVNGRVPVIAGTGCAATKQTIEMSKYAKNVGADAALVVTPFYLKPSDRGIYEHYRRIAEALDGFPLIMYNIPQVTGVTLGWPLVEDLAEIDNIVGLKDSSGQLPYMMAVLEKVRDKIFVMCGHDEVVLPALAGGANGVILASANVIPDMWLKLYKAAKEGKVEEARKVQMQIQKFARIIVGSGAVGVKEALKAIGINAGAPRWPLSVGGELSFENREEIRIELEKFGKIVKKTIEFEVVPGVPVEDRFAAVEITPKTIKDFSLKVGEALIDSGSEVAHIDVMIGRKDGPVGEGFAKAKANPAPGHEALLAVLEPNLPVKPPTLIMPTVTIRNLRQSQMIFGPAQAGVAKGVVDSVADGIIPKGALDDLVIVANVFVHPSAVDRHRVFINNWKAMRQAIRRAMEGRPTAEELERDKEAARHPFKHTP